MSNPLSLLNVFTFISIKVCCLNTYIIKQSVTQVIYQLSLLYYEYRLTRTDKNSQIKDALYLPHGKNF